MSSHPDILEISLNDYVVGTLTRLVDETIVFAFDPSYESNENRPILSLSYKSQTGSLIQNRTRTATRLNPFFSNLLPEGYLRDYLARKLNISGSREFFLLKALGLDLPGAVIAKPLGASTSKISKLIDRKEDKQLPGLRFSLAGVQLKFSAIAETKGSLTIPANGRNGSWIVKLPGEIYSHVPEAEYSMLEFARLSGIEVPEFKLVPTKNIKGLPAEFQDIKGDSLAVKRFDRTTSGGRIHAEDFAQVYGVYPQNKYEKAGYAHIARVLWLESGEGSYCEFIRRLVFTIAIGNGDMHLKNWCLLYTNSRKPALSPAYDFVPTISYIKDDTLALNLSGHKNFQEINIEHFKKMAAMAEAPEKLTARIVEESIEAISTQWKSNKLDLPLPNKIRQDLDNHMAKLPLFKAKRKRK